MRNSKGNTYSGTQITRGVNVITSMRIAVLLLKYPTQIIFFITATTEIGVDRPKLVCKTQKEIFFIKFNNSKWEALDVAILNLGIPLYFSGLI